VRPGKQTPRFAGSSIPGYRDLSYCSAASVRVSTTTRLDRMVDRSRFRALAGAAERWRVCVFSAQRIVRTNGPIDRFSNRVVFRRIEPAECFPRATLARARSGGTGSAGMDQDVLRRSCRVLRCFFLSTERFSSWTCCI